MKKDQNLEETEKGIRNVRFEIGNVDDIPYPDASAVSIILWQTLHV